MMLTRTRLLGLAALLAIAAPLPAAEKASALTRGKPELKSAGPLAFGPQGILFVGDPQGGRHLRHRHRRPHRGRRDGPAEGRGDRREDRRPARHRGQAAPDQRPGRQPALRQRLPVGVARHAARTPRPVLVRVDRSGKIESCPLEDVQFAKATLPNAAGGPRSGRTAITHLAYVEGRVYVAGLSNEEFSSRLRLDPVPVRRRPTTAPASRSSTAPHGQFETASPVRTFAPYKINGETEPAGRLHLHAAGQVPGRRPQAGRTGQGHDRRRAGQPQPPLDMIVYQKDGKDYVLMANSSRGVMKIAAGGLDEAEAHHRNGSRTRPACPTRRSPSLEGVRAARPLRQGPRPGPRPAAGGSLNLETVPLP